MKDYPTVYLVYDPWCNVVSVHWERKDAEQFIRENESHYAVNFDSEDWEIERWQVE